MDLRTFLHIIIESGFALFCLLSAIYIRLYDNRKSKTYRVMTVALLMNTVINIADALAYVYRGNPTDTGYRMVRISNFVVFIGMFALLALGNILLESMLQERGGGEDKKYYKAVFILCASGAALIILSSFFGFLYSFDAQNRYHRGLLFPVIPAIAAVAVILLLLRTFNEREHLHEREYRAMVCLWILPVLGMAAQVLYYGISLSNICNSIAIIILTLVFFRETIDGLTVKRSFILSGETIEGISGDIDRFLEGTGTERQNRIRIRFTVEEALIRIWERFGSLNMVKVTAGIRFRKPSIRIEHTGDAFNPFGMGDSANDNLSSKLLASAGISPTYSYTHGTNIMKIPMSRMSIHPVIVVLCVVTFGVISGSVALLTLSEGDVAFVANDLLVPIYDLWNNILYSVSAPAMLIIVMSTILDTREVSEQGGNAGILTGRYFGIMLAVGTVTILAASLVSRHSILINSFSKYTLTDLLKSFFSVVPYNLLDPIRDFNTAQLILIGIIFAYATMAVGQEAGGIASLIHELNLVSMQIAQWIAQLMPVFMVFLTALLVLSHNAQLLVSLVSVIPFALLVSALVTVAVLLFVSQRMGVKPLVLLKKVWPPFIQTIKTGHVSDSYALAEKVCIRDLGIQKIYTQRVLPLGLVLYMPASIVGMISFVIYAAFMSGLDITPVWIIRAIVFALILLVAAPPIPGVNLLSYVVIIGQLGIAKEYVLAAVVFDIIFDSFGAAANQMMLQLDMLLQAEHVGLLNHKIMTQLK